MRILYIILVVLVACKHDVPDAVHTKTKLIAHRGFGNNIHTASNPRENTLKAAEMGLAVADGIEVDIQRSNDHGVFLFHDKTLPKCGGTDIYSITASTKPDIIKQFKCLFPEDSITELQELLSKRHSYGNKDIFLDLKAFVSFKTLLRKPTPQHYYNLLVIDIFDLIQSDSNLGQLHIESENAVALNAFKSHYPKVNTWLASFGDFDVAIDRAFKEHYTGVSVKNGDYITEESVLAAHQKGLKVCVWVVNDQSRLDELVEMKVDYIQTDALFK